LFPCAPLGVFLRPPELCIGRWLFLEAPELGDHDINELTDRIVGATGIHRNGSSVAIGAQTTEDRVSQTALLADILKQARAHRTAEHCVEHVARVAILLILPVSVRAVDMLGCF